MRLIRLAAAAVLMGLISIQGAASQEMSSDPATAPAGAYKLDKGHASVTLKVSHLGLSYVTMRFDQVDASYSYDPANPAASKINVSLKPASIDTGDAAFNALIADQFLRPPSFRPPPSSRPASIPGPGARARWSAT